MAVEAVLEHGLNAEVANGRLTAEGSEEFALPPLDVPLDEVADFRYEAPVQAGYYGALVLVDEGKNEVILRMNMEDVAPFIEALREAKRPAAVPVETHRSNA